MQVEPGQEHLLVSSSSDNSLAVWDSRKLGRGCRALARAAHSLTCQSAFFAPDGEPAVHVEDPAVQGLCPEAVGCPQGKWQPRVGMLSMLWVLALLYSRLALAYSLYRYCQKALKRSRSVLHEV